MITMMKKAMILILALLFLGCQTPDMAPRGSSKPQQPRTGKTERIAIDNQGMEPQNRTRLHVKVSPAFPAQAASTMDDTYSDASGKGNRGNSAQNRTRLHVRVFPPPPETANLAMDVSFSEPSGNRALDAEEKGVLRVTLMNKGPGKAFGVALHVRAFSGDASVALPDSVRIGDIPAGKKVRKNLRISGGRDMGSGKLKLEVTAPEANGFDADPVRVTLTTRKFEPARLEVVDLGIEDQSKNGQVEPVEVVEATARIRNTGFGSARGVAVRVKLGKNVYPAMDSALDFDLGDMGPGEWRDVRFSFYTNKKIKSGEKIPIQLAISDRRGDVNEKASLALVMNVPRRKTREIVIEEKKVKEKPGREIASLSVDVDRDIPRGVKAGPFDVAVIIGNGDYKRQGVPTVEYAYRDLGVVREYLLKAFGFSPENILEERDATKGTFEMLFGTRDTPRGKLANWVKPGKSRVFIYYVGHGAPDLQTGNGYFVPSDADPDYIANTGYPLDVFYANLKRIPARELVVVLDACFSGRTEKGMLFKNISPAMLKVRETPANLKTGAVLASARADQVSCWYPEKRHGMFTYFFLKGLRGEADANGDGRITVGEMEIWLSEHVPYWARRVAGKTQEPLVEGRKNLVLVQYPQ